jgi:anti-sigma regulatory factor (Ser/Thr protein kinase)
MHSHPHERAPGEVVALLDLATLPSAPFWARRQTRTVLRAWRIWAETIETAELLVSELVTNAVKFAGPVPEPSCHPSYRSARRISLVLRHQPGQLIIEVSDPDPRPPVVAEVDSEAEGGRGLMLVQALSKEWNFYLPSTGGKVVYCVLATMASP